jgi:hypothetical protein
MEKTGQDADVGTFGGGQEVAKETTGGSEAKRMMFIIVCVR